jgi:hypothetical protein
MDHDRCQACILSWCSDFPISWESLPSSEMQQMLNIYSNATEDKLYILPPSCNNHPDVTPIQKSIPFVMHRAGSCECGPVTSGHPFHSAIVPWKAIGDDNRLKKSTDACDWFVLPHPIDCRVPALLRCLYMRREREREGCWGSGQVVAEGSESTNISWTRTVVRFLLCAHRLASNRIWPISSKAWPFVLHCLAWNGLALFSYHRR